MNDMKDQVDSIINDAIAKLDALKAEMLRQEPYFDCNKPKDACNLEAWLTKNNKRFLAEYTLQLIFNENYMPKPVSMRNRNQKKYYLFFDYELDKWIVSFRIIKNFNQQYIVQECQI
jgi:hypothetical protein